MNTLFRASAPLVFLLVFAPVSAPALSAGEVALEGKAKPAAIEFFDPSAAALIEPDSVRLLADGYSWTEGPLWLPSDAALLFEDMLNNRMCRWKEGEGASVFLEKSGDTDGTCRAHNPGSNGMALGPDGLVYFCQHGDRRIVKMDPATRRFTTVVDRYHGQRLNSPNDLIFDAAGNLYFTDPPYGLVNESDSELGFSGVYRLATDGTLTLLLRNLSHPNGIALSPDGHTLYVNDSDEKTTAVHAYCIACDGSLGADRLFWNAVLLRGNGPGVADGMKADERGNLWTSGPGGIYVLSPEGRMLALIRTSQPTSNCAFGGDDGRTLFITVNHSLLSVRTSVRAARFCAK